MTAVRRRLLANLAIALLVACCGRGEVRTSFSPVLDGAGIRLEAALPSDRPVVLESDAVMTALDTAASAGVPVRVTGTRLVLLSGPGDPRLGWDPASERIAYAITFEGKTAAGLVLVSATSGDVLFVTAY